jgi:hypothetical protein
MPVPRLKPPAPPKPPSPEENHRRMGVLIAITVFWALLFIVTIIWHSRLTARLIPIVGVIGLAYAAYCSYRLLKKQP